MRRAALAAAFLPAALLWAAASCEPGPASSVSFIELEPVTFSLDPLGISGDAEDLGLKRISIAVANTDATRPIEVRSALVTRWFAGSNAGAQTYEIDVSALTPNDLPSPGLSFNLPGSELLGICEAMYYSWTITYRFVNTNSPGSYFGQAKRIMPTRDRLPNGSVHQALCAEPPAPEA